MNVGGCIGVYMCVAYYHMNANEFYVAFMETETFRSQRMGKMLLIVGSVLNVDLLTPLPLRLSISMNFSTFCYD